MTQQDAASKPVRLGLRANLPQFALLVGVNALVGGMIGQERTVLPLLGQRVFHLHAFTAALDCSAVLDVRQRDEFLSGHVPGARNVELGALGGVDDLPAEHLTVMCGHGERAMTGASVLERAGRADVAVLLGGPSDWATASGRAVATGP